MITIQIGENERKLFQATEQWVNEQINRRLRANQLVCVRVTIEEELVNMSLVTQACARNGHSDWVPNTKEKRIIDIWKKLGMSKPEFTGGNLNAFLKQLTQLV